MQKHFIEVEVESLHNPLNDNLDVTVDDYRDVEIEHIKSTRDTSLIWKDFSAE